MYTNDGILAMISVRDTAANFGLVRAVLNDIDKGEVEASELEHAKLIQWELDIKAHFVRRAELLGMTNVASSGMDFP